MRLLKPKVSIIGAGSVGSSFAFALMMRGLAREIVIVDKNGRRYVHCVNQYDPIFNTTFIDKPLYFAMEGYNRPAVWNIHPDFLG